MLKTFLEIRMLGDCAHFFSGGTPSKSNPDYWVGSIPWVSCKDMKVPRLYDAEDHLSEEGCKKGTRIVQPGTILIVVRGMILAKEFPVAMAMREIAFNQDLKALCCKDGVDSWFLYYWLLANSYEVRGLVDEAAHGTTRLQSDRLLSLEVNLPPLSTQRTIASILSAYDDLIENNTRRIKILEEMARMLYREWFVNFRFPGYEQVKMVDSPLGLIPEGWEVGNINDVVSIKSGFAFKSTTFVDEGAYGLVTIKNVQDGQFNPDCSSQIEDLPQRLPDYCLLNDGDILLSLTGNIGRTCLVYGNDLLLNQRVAKLVPLKPKNRAFAYFAFRQDEMRAKLEQISNGVAQQNLSPVETGRMEFCVPFESVLSRFSDACEPLINQLLVMYKRNKNLRKTRDLLLPKLISGEIEIPPNPPFIKGGIESTSAPLS